MSPESGGGGGGAGGCGRDPTHLPGALGPEYSQAQGSKTQASWPLQPQSPTALIHGLARQNLETGQICFLTQINSGVSYRNFFEVSVSLVGEWSVNALPYPQLVSVLLSSPGILVI